MYDDAIKIAKDVADMTGTKVNYRLLGTAWPGHFNKNIAQATYKNAQMVGLPVWDSSDQQLARAVQKLVSAPKKDFWGRPIDGLATKLDSLWGPVPFSWGGGSDDIGDISWNLPTIVLGYPSNIPGTPGHNWADAIAMATPIAHKGVIAGAKTLGTTLIDMITDPKIIADAWTYFKEVQTKEVKYIPFLDNTPPAVNLNKAKNEKLRPELKKYYYDPSKYKTYLEQLGIKYPTLEKKNF
jgi:aminobenzoyl-glutamate utilization protein B